MMVLGLLVVLTGCGGGGGGGSTSASTNSGGASSGGSNSSSGTGNTGNGGSSVNNVIPVTVDQGPASAPSNLRFVNHMYVSVTVCVPGTANCTTIDHILLDTGSAGLRLSASALPAGFNLPQRNNSVNQSYAECMLFVGGYSWGPLKTADIHLGAETAAGAAVQILGDSNYQTVPSTCSNAGATANSLSTSGINGLLGVWAAPQDCGPYCATTANSNTYYACPTPQSCTQTMMALSDQIANPIVLFPQDNNGSIISLPAIPDQGQTTVSGTLTFGIGTQSNNGLGSATVIPLNGYLELGTTYNGASYPNSYIDSGTNFYALPNMSNSIPNCTMSPYTGFLCPSSQLNLSGNMIGTDNVSHPVPFIVGNAQNLLTANPGFNAFDNLAYPSSAGISQQSSSFAWSTPFFYGKNVYTAIAGATTPSKIQPPYVAF